MGLCAPEFGGLRRKWAVLGQSRLSSDDSRDACSSTEADHVLYPTGETATLGYDDAGRLTYVSDGASKVVTYTYDAANRPLTVTLRNGVESAYGYDEAGRLTSIAHQKPGTWQTGFQYQLDRAGRSPTTTAAT